MMTEVYSWSGRDEDARIESAEVLRLDPNFSLEKSEKAKNQSELSCLKLLRKKFHLFVQGTLFF